MGDEKPSRALPDENLAAEAAQDAENLPDVAPVDTESYQPRRAVKRGLSAKRLVFAWVALIVVVAVALGMFYWTYFGTNQLARNEMRPIAAQFKADCARPGGTAGGPSPSPAAPTQAASPSPAPQPEHVIGLLDIPAIGQHDIPIWSGTDTEHLAKGAAWYPLSAKPGELGNTVLAGYRATHGAIFDRLGDLAKGDIVTIWTCEYSYDYEIRVPARDVVIKQDEDWVLSAVPGDAGRVPTNALLTLITSQDKLPTPERMVAFGYLVNVKAN